MNMHHRNEWSATRATCELATDNKDTADRRKLRTRNKSHTKKRQVNRVRCNVCGE